MTFHLTQRQGQQAQLMASDATHIMGYGGSRCLSGDAVLDGHTRTIAELAAAGEPVCVLTSHGWQMAEAPFRKGAAEMLTFELSNGRSVTVTSDHRFWTGAEWKKADEFSEGDAIAVRRQLTRAASKFVGSQTADHDRPDDHGYQTIRVAYIDTAPHQDFFTLHVPGCEHYFANGILHHNSGKTFGFCRGIALRAQLAPGSRHAIFRFRFNHIKASIIADTWPKMMDLCFPGVDAHCKLDKTDWYYEFPNSSQVWFAGLDDKERVEKVLGQEYCIDPDGRVLMANLTWRAARDVRKGDEIVAFPENLDGHQRLIRATVEFNKPLQKKRYRVVTTKGETIVSEGHKFVAYYDDRRVRNFRSLSWRTAESLNPGDLLRFSVKPWATDQSRNGGWMAGILDGEGWIGVEVGFAQNPGAVLDHANELLNARGINVREYENGKCHNVVAASMWDAMRMVGMLRPERLTPKSTTLWEGRYGFNGRGDALGSASRHKMRTDARHVAEVLSIEELPVGEVRAIQTSSKTLITDGFLSHNCTLFFNECSQIPYASRVMAISRLAQAVEKKEGGQLRLKAYYDMNPVGMAHWTYKLFVEKRDPDRRTPLPNPENFAAIAMNPDHNKENLPAVYLDELSKMPEAARRRFFLGQFANMEDSQLWSMELLDQNRIMDGQIPQLIRIVVAVDPSGARGDEDMRSDEIGIIVVGLGIDGRAYVLEDLSGRMGPADWAAVAVAAYDRHKASQIVAETNFGGGMVAATIKAAANSPDRIAGATLAIPVIEVTASRGKVVRAEPIAALYEQKKVSHVGHFEDLEDQLQAFTTNGYIGTRSPDRGDALVWALTALFPALTRKDEVTAGHRPAPKVNLGHSKAKARLLTRRR